MHVNLRELNRPVPPMADLRARKSTTGYAHIPVSPLPHPNFYTLVDLRERGIAGQPYYSRPQAMTGDPIPGLPPQMWVRKPLADILVDINNSLRHPAITEFFGGEVELYVEEALRPLWLQAQLRDIVTRELIRRGMRPADAEMRAAEVIAPGDHTAPHASGGAIACVLRTKQPGLNYVPDAKLWLGYDDADTSDRREPDYFEDPAHVLTDDDRLAQRNRRASLAIMTGRAFGRGTGLAINPSLVYQYNLGNRQWAMIVGLDTAYYDAAEVAT